MSPLEDGTKHCNVYHNAKTPLGRMLSPLYEAEFELPDDGKFQSVGGYWCWLLFEDSDDRFRNMSGKDLLVNSNIGNKTKVNSNEFQEKILHATWQKIRQNSNIFWRFEQNILPYRRYKVIDGCVYRPSDADWLTNGLTIMEEYIDQHFW